MMSRLFHSQRRSVNVTMYRWRQEVWLTIRHTLIGASLPSAISDLLLLKGEDLIKEPKSIHHSVTCRYAKLLAKLGRKSGLCVSLQRNYLRANLNAIFSLRHCHFNNMTLRVPCSSCPSDRCKVLCYVLWDLKSCSLKEK
jgi:hypothetical protein